MNIDVIDAISNLCKSTILSAQLRLCQFRTIDDFINFNDTTIDKIEQYIQIQCSLMEVNERTQYLSVSDLHNPEEFLFTPGMRNKLLKAVDIILSSSGMKSQINMTQNVIPFQLNNLNQIQQNYSQNLPHFMITRNNIMPHEIDNIQIQEVTPNLTEASYENVDNKELENVLNNVNSSSRDNVDANSEPNESEKSGSNCFEIGGFTVYKDQYYKDTVETLNSSFTGLNLVAKKDFDLEFHFNETDVSDSYAYYICHACNHKKLKFKFTHSLTILYGNIKSHLKNHSIPGYNGNNSRSSNLRKSRKRSKKLTNDYIYDD